ncbi:methyltransferase [Oceanicola sp. 22II-s10i]|uniref:tRNA1(Val) (adenine(37)-N6)-methyltransferase n=1 Tax=Oceanicola sp. 22II-s10i TaxID=1317116 RepID=UPI000B52238D|nr:methyltransferase [Oceanicola sp. 22II-s10i]OWU85410.1 methyltransferase [Oceanicola sp. 22II-s10i]
MDDADLTHDAFLGGRLRLWQPRRGYRAGVDPVFLAAATPARPGQSLLDLGCGTGAAALCAGTRVPGLILAGLERQPDYATLAARNAAENGIAMDVVTGDLTEMPAALRQRQFDHVIANPPYFDRSASLSAADTGREAALGEDTPLALWVQAAARRCAPGGTVTFIHRVERLPDLLTAFAAHLGSLELKPLIPRTGRESQLFLLRGRKGGRARFRLHHGLIVHRGAVHEGDRADYTETAGAILRSAAEFDFSFSS